jgi:hypothetical protein
MTRAGYLKDGLQALLVLGPPAARRIRTVLSREALDAVAEATRLDWLPAEYTSDLTDAVAGEVGPPGTREWARAMFVRTSETQLVKPFIQAAAQLFGMTPAGLLRYAPQIWESLHRHCGTLSAEERSRQEQTVSVVDLAEPLRRLSFLDALAGALEAVANLSDRPSEVTLEAHSLDAGTARYRVAWR